MTPQLQPYPAYQGTDLSWLGKIPAHWETHRLRSKVDLLVSNVDKHTFEDEEPVRLCNYVDVYKNEVIHEGLSFMRATASTDEIQRFRLRKGDVVITKDSETWDDIGVPALVDYEAPDFVCSYHLAILRPYSQSFNGAYLLRSLQTPSIASQLHVSANGVTRFGLTHQAIKSIHILLPPPGEQAAIVRYLDHVDRRIRRYIRAKRRLIALLNEQKQAIIHHAVTQGLDPDAPRKPSGVEWLGDIPAHWDIKRLKHLFHEVDDRTQDGSEVLLSLRMYQGLVPHNEVSDRPITSDDIIGYKITRPGQMVMNRMRAALGMFAVTPQIGVVSPDYAIFNSINDVIPEYYLHLFKTPLMKSIFLVESKGLGTGSSGFLRLYSDKFGILKVPFPNKEEQVAIVDFIRQVTQEISSTITTLEREIDLMREYRTRLIADVVTGKLDVRAAAATLPPEDDWPEAGALDNEPEDDIGDGELDPELEDELETDDPYEES